MTYQSTVRRLTLVTAILVAIGLTLFLTAPFGKGISLAQASAENTPATGAPTISSDLSPLVQKTPRVTQTLWAHTRGIEDEDGMEDASFTYQWVSHDGATDTEIAGATGRTYILQSSDEGKTFKVRVTFTDDLGNSESVTSAATAKVVAADAGICGRTPVVIDELVWFADTNDCALVTDEYLAGITGWILFVGHLSVQIPPAPRIDSFKAGDFAGLSNLERLIMRKTGITELPAGVFNGLSDLRELKLDRNTNLATVYSGTFTGLRLLTDLIVDDSALTELPDDVFDGLLVLETLDLSDNELTTLPKGVFDNLTYLEELNLIGNGLTGLEEGIFDELVDLERLYLSRNSLSFLSADLFSELDNLERLSLWKNSLDDLPDDIFKDLDSLEVLSLNENNFDELPAGVFDDLSGLKRLYLDGNQLDALPDGLFAGWTSLVSLWLEDNPGSPFVFDLEVAREDDDTVVVNVSNATPFDISITLEATGGSLSATEVTLPAGGTSTEGIDVTPDGEAAVTIRVVSAAFDAQYFDGIAVGRGGPFSLGDNNQATGQPTISGTAQVGQTLTPSTSGIADDDGLSNATYAYQWVSSDGPTDRDIDGATSSTYTITASELGRMIKVLVTFEDDGGNSEAVTSAATEAVTAAPNIAATGKPAIVGDTIIRGFNTDVLTVDLTSIADDNGVPDSGFRYYWICVEDGEENRCAGDPFQSTYQASRYERGAYLKVSVKFMDDGGNWETLVSDPVGPVAWPNSSARGAPLLSGAPIVGEWLTAHPHGIHDGNGTQKHHFDRTYQWFADGTEIEGATGNGYTVSSDVVGKRIHFVLYFKDDDGWEEALESPPTAFVVAADSENSPPRGAPQIRIRHSSGSNGEAHYIEVGDTITTVTTTGYRGTNITDADGLTNAVFTYQWMRGDGTTYTDIPDATSMNYTLQDGDEGKTLKVKVTFTDDLENQHSMFSAPSSPVDPGPTPSANNPAQGNATISGTAKVGETLTVDVSGITDADGMEDASFGFTWTDGTYWLGISYVDMWEVLPSYVGKQLTVHWNFYDDMGYHESGEVTSAVVVATVPEEPRAVAVEPGGPGKLDVSWVEPDSDGGSEITSYTVQWKKATGIRDADEDVSEATATSTTHTITGLELDVEYAVRIIATNSIGDGAASDEVTATTVAAKPNSPATGTPTISGTAQVGETLTADTTGIDDSDGLADVSYNYQWLADDAEIAGATGNTYVLTSAELGNAVKVRVSFTDDAGNEESLTSAATDAVATAPPPPPDNVRAITQESGAVELTWEAPQYATVTGYRIERSRAYENRGGQRGSDGRPRDNHTLVEDTGSAETGYTDKSAEKGVEYEYRVSARNEAGAGEGSEWVRAGPQEEPVLGDGLPGAPRNLTATPGNKEVTLSWDPPDDNGNAPATRYRIEWRVDGKDYDKNHWGTARSTTYTTNDQANLANGVKYFFRVRAENDDGNSYGPYGPSSEEVSATPTSGSVVDLGTPVLSDTETLHHGMVQLDWQDIEDAGWYVAQYYHVKSGEWLDLPAEGVDIAFHGSGAVVSNLHGLSWLRVRAMSCTGESEWSQIEQLFGTNESDWEGVPVPEVEEGDEIEPCPVVLGTPVLSDTETLHHGMVQLDWQDIEDAGWYVVQYYHVKSGEWLDLPAEGVDIAFHGSSAVASNLHGLSWLRVQATSCAGESEWSQIEQLFGTNASDWEGVPVPEVAEGDEIEPCSEDADTPENSPATGAPTISGTAQVGEALEADTSGIADSDGLSNVQYEYQWLADDADIAGASGSTYTLTDSEESKAIKVEVSFTDDAGNDESLTSEPTTVVAAAPPPPPDNVRAVAKKSGAVELTWDAPQDATVTGYRIERRPTDGSPSDQERSAGSTRDNHTLVEDTGSADTGYTDDTAERGVGYEYRVSARNEAGAGEESDWVNAEEDVASNSTATGAPTISGTAQVGETLTANTSGVADADGLSSVQYEYQWIADDTDIAGATGSTYTLTDSEESKAIEVQVSFTDDADNEETLTSAATAAVAAKPNSPATGAPTISGTAQVGETLTANTSGVADADGLSSVQYEYQWIADDTDIAGATGSTYTLTDSEESKAIEVQVSFTDDADNEETLTSAATAAVAAKPNSPATGAPTISGTAQVGETLTANTSGVADADGLGSVQYEYQWLADDTDIAGATGSTYTLTDSEESKAITVQVSFTDDAGNEETLTSAATTAVAGAVPDQVDSGAPSYITVEVTEDYSDPINIVTNFAITWSDAAVCSVDYNAYLNIKPSTLTGDETEGSQFHLGSAASDGAQITAGLTGVQGGVRGFDVELYCGTDGSGRLVSRVVIPGEYTRPKPGTYSSEPPLSALSVSHGTMTPTFQGGTSRYTVPDVANAETRITITATPKEGNFVKFFEGADSPVIGLIVDAWGLGPRPSGLSEDCSRGFGDYYGPLIEMTDADPDTPGLQVDLYDDKSYVWVHVYPTAVCTLGKSYALTITRAEGEVSLPRPNRPAIGLPVIAPPGRDPGWQGSHLYIASPCVGCTMNAFVSSIKDRDGWDESTFSYQWLADDADITGATSSSYTAADTDLGKTLKVRVSFTDDRGNEETLTSLATEVVRLRNFMPTGKPVILGTPEVGQTLRVDVSGISDPNGMTNATFTYQWVNTPWTDDEYTLADSDEGRRIWVQAAYTDDAGHMHMLESAPTDAVAARPSSPATGAPTISGTAQVGETLTVDTSGIADENGLENVAFTYQWLADDADISGAINATYTLAAEDEGNAITVQVSFTDDAGNDETLTSAATDAVVSAALPPPPDNVRAVTQKSGAVDLTWEAPGDATVTGYRIDRRRAGGDRSDQERSAGRPRDHHALVEDTGSTNTGYTDTGAEKGVGYEYRVSARNEAGAGAGSDWVKAGPPPAPNSPATGLPSISGTAQVGETLTADTSAIADADGRSGATFSYQWVANDGNSDSDITGATDSTYTLVAADEGKAIKVRISFTDDADNEETLTSVATTAVAGAVDSGAPSYITVEVTEDYSDPINIVTNFAITWSDTAVCSVDYNAYLNIKPSTLTGDETEGSQLHLGSAASDGAQITAGLTGVQGGIRGFDVELYCGTDGSGRLVSRVVIPGEYTRPRPSTYSSEPPLSALGVSHGTMTPTFQGGTSRYTVPDVANAETRTTITATPTEGNFVKFFEGSDSPVIGLMVDAWGLGPRPSGLSEDCSRGFGDYYGPLIEMTDADPDTPGFQMDLYDGTSSVWVHVYPTAICSLGKSYALTITRAEGEISLPRPNRPAIGLPVIAPPGRDPGSQGTYLYFASPCVGCTMNAYVSSIKDRDGWDESTFSYQWLADDADITGATGFTYTVADTDLGKTLKVRVSFTDGRGNEETLTSLATEVVKLRNFWPTGKPVILGTAEVGQTLRVDVSGISDPNGMTNAAFTYQWVNTPWTDSNEYTLADSDEGRRIWLRAAYTDDAGHMHMLESAPTDAVAARPSSPATGAPTISGTAQVGETLTADTSGIADENGLSNVQYEYQWLADDADIAGATGSTYTLTDSEESKAITVQVSFTDDADNEETLTSAATAAVAGAQPTEPPAKPTGLDATASHDSVTLTWDDPGDDSITGYVILRRIPGVDPEGHFNVLVANTGTAATTYTDDTVSAKTRYTYRIKAINGAGTSERSRWFHIDTPAAPVPDQPTGLEATESHGQVVLTWDDPGDDSITGYVILRRVRENDTGGDFSVLVADTGTAALTYTDDTVAAGTTYTYRIKAINEHGTSERSRWFHIDIPEAP